MAWLPRIILEAPLQERTSRVGLRLLRGKVISFHLLITCQSPKKALETFWMAEVAFLDWKTEAQRTFLIYSDLPALPISLPGRSGSLEPLVTPDSTLQEGRRFIL